MPKLLSTKTLSSKNLDRLLTAGFSVVHYDAISIQILKAPSKTVKNAIVTSQNTLRAMLEANIKADNIFCVGEKTKAMLIENGFRVVLTADYAENLAHQIVAEYPKEQFHFFCGNRRRDDLPEILKNHQISFVEEVVYKSEDVVRHFTQTFDVLLFFSPSAVHSFYAQNTMPNATAIAIGNTTAEAVKQYTQNYTVAKKPDIDLVVTTAIQLKKELYR